MLIRSQVNAMLMLWKRDAMNKFRDDMLDPKRRIIKKPRMHCNYKNFDHVGDVLENEWDNLIEHALGQDGYEKHRLIACQIYGLMELLDLPAYERCVFAQGDLDAAIAGRPIKRTFDYKYPSSGFGKTFPVFSKELLLAHSGAGVDFWISILGSVDRDDGRLFRFLKLVSSKSNKGQELLCSNNQTVTQQMTSSPAV